jgi:hypothetical protein
MLAQVLDHLIAFAARDETQLLDAREQWAEAAGRVFDDDALYEERATAFLEWFAIERPGPDGRTPAERLRAQLDDGAERRWIDALSASHRSLFQVREVRPGALVVDDLLAGGAFEVTERRKLPGVGEGELFEARLVADVTSPPEVLFSRSFQFHPREAATQVRRQAAKARAAGAPRGETLFRLARLRLRALRYGHVGADKIYAGDDPSS